MGEFFSTIPDMFVALWDFSGGFRGVLVAAGSAVLTAAFAFGAKVLRETAGWLSAVLGLLAATIVMWWVFGILPSAWVYFSDGQEPLLAGTVIPSALPGLTDFYTVFRDLVVLLETTVAVLAFVVIALRLQKHLPRALAEGEESRPQSGGYK